MKKRIKCHNQSHNRAKENLLDSACGKLFLDSTSNSRLKKEQQNTPKQTELLKITE